VFIFISFSLEKHKEMRLLISLFPFLYALTAVGLVSFAEIFKKNKNIALNSLIALFLIQAIPQLEFNKYEDNLDAFYKYINSTNINDRIWISNPSFIVFSDKKAGELIYYHIFDSTKAKALQNKVINANLVMINTCDILPCHPNDKNCGIETAKLLDLLKSKMQLKFYKETNVCGYYIFEI